MITGERFPLTQIDQGGVATMMRQLGGDPVIPSQVEGLLESSALPLFDQDKNLQHLFLMAGYGSIEAFGLEGDEEIDAFCAGGYLYAASLMQLTPLTEVPLHDSVYKSITDTDNHDFVQDAYRTLYIEQAPIVGLINKVERVLDLDRQRRKIAIVGAGTLHIITTRSLLAEADTIANLVLQGIETVEGALFEYNHPELRELEAQFQDFNPDDLS